MIEGKFVVMEVVLKPKRKPNLGTFRGVKIDKLLQFETELDAIVPMYYPKVAKHRGRSKDNRSKLRALHAIYCLAKGLDKYFTEDQYRYLVRSMKGRTAGSFHNPYEMPITADEVKKAVNRKYSEKERYKIYEYLSNAARNNVYVTPPANLDDCLFNQRTGFSFIIFYWLRPTGYDRTPKLNTKPIVEELGLAKDMINKRLDRREKYYLEKNLLEMLKEFEASWEAELRPYSNYDDFTEFFQEYMIYLEDKYSRGFPSPGFFRITSLPFKRFLRTLEDEDDEEDDTMVGKKYY